MAGMRLKTVLAMAVALWVLPAAHVAAQSVTTLPVEVQYALRTAASQGQPQLAAAVQKAVAANPSLAQSIVNQAAALKPAMTNQLVAVANTALSKHFAAAAAAAAASGAPAAISTTGMVIGGVVATGAAAGVAVAVGGSESEDTPAQAEFAASYALGQIGANSAYNRGATGAGVLIGVVDSGIDENSAEFTGRIATGGQNFISGRTASNIQDSPLDGHGTHVAGIIAANKNNTGMHGVAYESDILVLRTFETVSAVEDYTGSNSDFADAWVYGDSMGVKVYNGSYGSAAVNVSASAVHFDAIENALDNGAIAVFSAGNDGYLDGPGFPAGMPYIQPANDAAAAAASLYVGNTGKDYSALADRLIAVVATDRNGSIASYSNRCGYAAAWCIAAPGTDIFSTVPDVTYMNMSGTSMAAPLVTGAVALLIDLYPSLTPVQIVDRLFTTATKTGVYADTSVYGNGFLNLGTATSLVANGFMMTGNTLADRSFSLEQSSIKLAPAFGDGLSASLSNRKMAVVDSFDGAPIRMAANSMVEIGESSNTIDDGARGFGRGFEVEKFDGAISGTVSWRQVPGNSEHDAYTESRIVTSFSPDTQATIGYMSDPALGFGLMGEGTVDVSSSRSGGAFLSPYLGLTDNNLSFVTETEISDIKVRAGSFFGSDEDKRSEQTFGAATEMVFSPFTGSSVGIQAGFVSEGSTFLGTGSEGAFDMGRTTTSYGGISGSLQVARDTEVVGSFFLGVSQIDPVAGSLVTGFSGVTSDSFTLGIIHRNMLVKDDSFGFLINQPLRVSSGTASLRLPSGVDASYNVGYDMVNAGLSPTGREVDLEAFYASSLTDKTDLNLSLMYRHQPDHVADAPGEGQVMVRIEHEY